MRRPAAPARGDLCRAVDALAVEQPHSSRRLARRRAARRAGAAAARGPGEVHGLHRAAARGNRAPSAPRRHAASGVARLREVRGLSNEVRQRLLEHRPATLGQAARIPGVTPAAVSLLLVHLKRGATGAAAASRSIAGLTADARSELPRDARGWRSQHSSVRADWPAATARDRRRMTARDPQTGAPPSTSASCAAATGPSPIRSIRSGRAPTRRSTSCATCSRA